MLGTKQRSLQSDYKMCSRCIYDTSVPSITFNSNGVCNYCEITDTLKLEYGTGNQKGEVELDRLLVEIKKENYLRGVESVKEKMTEPIVGNID